MKDAENNKTASENEERDIQVVIELFPTTPEFFGNDEAFKYAQFPQLKLLRKKINIDRHKNRIEP